MRGTDFLLDRNAEGMDGSFFCIPAARCGGDEGGGQIEIGVLAMKKSWIVYRLQHYGNRRLFDFLLRTEPTVDAT